MKIIRTHGLFLILLLIVLVARVYLWHKASVSFSPDMLRYDAMATHVAFLGYLGYGSGPDAFVTPLYPLFVAMMYKLSVWVHVGHMLPDLRLVHQVFLVQQLVSLVTLTLTYILGIQLSGKRVGLAAALLSALYLPNSAVGLMLLTEALFIPLLLATLSSCIQALRTEQIAYYALTGVLLGLTVLVRPNVLPLLFVFAILIWWKRRRERLRRTYVADTAWSYLPTIALFFAGCVITLIPWWIRNALVFHKLILLSTEAGNPLLAGADPYFLVNINQMIAASRALHETQTAYAIHYMLQGFSHHFLLFAGWYLFGKLPYLLWTPWLYDYVKSFVLFHQVLVITGGLSMLLAFWHRKARVIAWTALFLLLVQLVFLPITRYGYPIVVLWCILLPVVVADWWARLRGEGGGGYA